MAEINDQMRDDAAAFVLGAMPEIEAQAFRREMMRDCELGRYVESLEAVGDFMLTAAPPIEVPDALGVALMAEARRDLEAREIVTSPRAGTAAEPAPQRGLLARIWKPAVGLAAAAAIAVGGYVIGENAAEPTQPAPVVATAEFQPAADKDASGEMRMVEGGAKGAVVEIAGLDPSIGSDTYQLWVLSGEKLTASTVFSVDSTGNGKSVVPQALIDGDAVMITREPAGGSQTPTSDVLAKATV